MIDLFDDIAKLRLPVFPPMLGFTPTTGISTMRQTVSPLQQLTNLPSKLKASNFILVVVAFEPFFFRLFGLPWNSP